MLVLQLPGIQICLAQVQRFSGKLYLSNVEVSERFRGKGFGNLILRKAEHYAKRKKAFELFLKCEKGTWVSKWYKRHGFTHFSDEDNFEWIKRDCE